MVILRFPLEQDDASACSPNGAEVNSQGREPLAQARLTTVSPNGAKVGAPRAVAPLGLTVANAGLDQGLTPLAIDDRRVAASMHAVACPCLSSRREPK